MRYIGFLIGSFLGAMGTWAQTTPNADTLQVSLQGKVSDEQGEPIPLCAIRVEGQGISTLASIEGRYQFRFNTADSVVISYNMMGFRTLKRVLRKPKGNLTLHVVLKEMGGELSQVVVSDSRRQLTNTQEINIEQIKHLPSTTGNAVEELVATQAGVSTHNELSSQYNVRGGSFDENCVYINGMEVYRPLLISSGQQEGLSVINSQMVEKVDFSAGGFEARYGDKMSSVLDITYARPKKREVSAQASLLGAQIYTGFGKRRFSFSQGLRYKTNQYMLGSLEDKGEYAPKFLDYQAYLNWMPHPDWSVDVITYINKNQYRFRPISRETSFGTLANVMHFKVYFDGHEKDLFQTLFSTFKVTRRWNSRHTLSLMASLFGTKERETYDIQGQYWLNETQSDEALGVGSYMEHARNLLNSHTQTLRMDYALRTGKHHIQTGLTWKHERIRENSREWEYRDSSGYNIPHNGTEIRTIYNLKSKHSIQGQRIELFAQDTWRHESNVGLISLNYGARLSYWNWNKEWLFSPRVCLGYVPKEKDQFTFRLSTGWYAQAPYYKELRDTVTVHGNTVVELNKKIRSQRSFQVLAAMDYKFKLAQRPFKFTTELYYKAQSKLNPYNVDNVKIVYYGNNCATGYVCGADFKLFGEFVPGTDSWVSFGLMKAQMKLNGQSIPQPTDQRYNFNLFFSDYFPGSTKWKMNLKFSIADGLPFGPPHTGLEENVFKAPAYKRVDIGMNYRLLNNEEGRKRKTPIRNIWLGVDCFNIFGIRNVSSYYWVTDIQNQQYAVPNYLTGRMINARILIEM